MRRKRFIHVTIMYALAAEKQWADFRKKYLEVDLSVDVYSG